MVTMGYAPEFFLGFIFFWTMIILMFIIFHLLMSAYKDGLITFEL